MANDRWADKIEIKSSSSDRVYTVARDVATGLYGCSCPAWRTKRTCKHLQEMNLPTEGPLTAQPATARKPRTTKAAADFADTKKHYDVHREGLGNPSEWRSLAENVVRGRGALKKPAKAPSVAVSSRMAADLAALGISAMPATADDLLAAMQARGEVLNHPTTGNPAAFWSMFESYSRLAESY